MTEEKQPEQVIVTSLRVVTQGEQFEACPESVKQIIEDIKAKRKTRAVGGENVG